METAKPGLTLFLPLESRTVVQPVRVMFSVLGTCLWGRHSLFAFDKEHRTLNTHRWHHHPDLEGQGRGQGLRLAVFKSEWCWRDHSHSCPGLSFWLNCNPHQETHFASSPSTHTHTHTHTHTSEANISGKNTYYDYNALRHLLFYFLSFFFIIRYMENSTVWKTLVIKVKSGNSRWSSG